MNKKKLASTLLAVGLVGIIGAGATLAYLTTSTAEKTNTFTVGDINIDLDEPKWNPDDGKDMKPGSTVDKNPIVTNTGEADGFIGISVENVKEMVERGFIIGILSDEADPDQGLKNGEGDVFCWNSVFTLVDQDGKTISAGSDNSLTEAELQELGDKLYFAYSEVLESGDQTPALFTGVQLTTAAEQGKTVQIHKWFTKGGSVYEPDANGNYTEGEPDKDTEGNYIYKYTVGNEDTVYDTYEAARAYAKTLKEADEEMTFDLVISSAAIQSENKSDPNWTVDNTTVWYPELPEAYLQ